MSDFGLFANIVAIAGSLAATTGALRIAWMKRAKWQPPEEAVPGAVGKIASLFSMVFVGLLYVYGSSEIGQGWLAIISIIGLIFAIIFLSVTIYFSVKYTFTITQKGKDRVLGGGELTVEAKKIEKKYAQTRQQMFWDSQGDKDLVWTKESQAIVQIVCTIAFIGLIASGTAAVAAISNLIAIMVNA